jgi:hypothetical protein
MESVLGLILAAAGGALYSTVGQPRANTTKGATCSAGEQTSVFWRYGGCRIVSSGYEMQNDTSDSDYMPNWTDASVTELRSAMQTGRNDDANKEQLSPQQ